MIARWTLEKNRLEAVKSQANANKWMSGNNRNVDDLIKRYNIVGNSKSSTIGRSASGKTWSRKKSEKEAKDEVIVSKDLVWVDNRYIKNYTDYSQMMSVIEEITRKYPKISERQVISLCLG